MGNGASKPTCVGKEDRIDAGTKDSFAVCT